MVRVGVQVTVHQHATDGVDVGGRGHVVDDRVEQRLVRVEVGVGVGVGVGVEVGDGVGVGVGVGAGVTWTPLFLNAVPVSTGTKALPRVPLRMHALSSSMEGSSPSR